MVKMKVLDSKYFSLDNNVPQSGQAAVLIIAIFRLVGL